MAGTMIKLCRLWRKQSRYGTEYLVGRLGGARLLIFERRDNDDDPASDHDMVAWLADPDSTGASDRGKRPRAAAPEVQGDLRLSDPTTSTFLALADPATPKRPRWRDAS